jgi:hypothetical protein
MPDKYSYKPGKKKKALRPPVAAQSPVIPAPAAAAAAQVRTASAPPATATKPAAAPPSTEGRNIARAGNLGSELRRVILLAGVVIVALVAASLTLT